MPARLSGWPLVLLFASFALQAHEIRPAYLEISEHADGSVEVLWRQPVAGEYTLAIAPELSSGWLVREPDFRHGTQDTLTRIWTIAAPREALAGQQLRIRGLDRTITDVLARIRFADGEEQVALVKAAEPELHIRPDAQGEGSVCGYFRLGLEHIASGVDHLLYLLGLILLIRHWRVLIGTVTAFTVAHSITLACSTLGAVALQGEPVEAAIALSIVFVAVELVRMRQGRTTLTHRAPWLVAFLFGLLHGFGFAGALREVGVPQDAAAQALLLFNLGIEAGQLLFVLGVTAVLAALQRSAPRLPAAALRVAPHAIGAIAACWLIERIAALA